MCRDIGTTQYIKIMQKSLICLLKGEIIRVLFTKRAEFWQKSAVAWGVIGKIKTKTNFLAGRF